MKTSWGTILLLRKRKTRWRELQRHQLAGCVIHCLAAHVETFHAKTTQWWGYFLTSVVNLYVSIWLWVWAGCVFHKVRRVCPGWTLWGSWHVSCFAHDNTVSFFKDTSCTCEPSEQLLLCYCKSKTVQRKKLLTETFPIFLSSPSEPQFKTIAQTSWIQRATTSGFNLGFQIPPCKVIK